MAFKPLQVDRLQGLQPRIVLRDLGELNLLLGLARLLGVAGLPEFVRPRIQLIPRLIQIDQPRGVI